MWRSIKGKLVAFQLPVAHYERERDRESSSHELCCANQFSSPDLDPQRECKTVLVVSPDSMSGRLTHY